MRRGHDYHTEHGLKPMQDPQRVAEPTAHAGPTAHAEPTALWPFAEVECVTLSPECSQPVPPALPVKNRTRTWLQDAQRLERQARCTAHKTADTLHVVVAVHRTTAIELPSRVAQARQQCALAEFKDVPAQVRQCCVAEGQTVGVPAGGGQGG